MRYEYKGSWYTTNELASMSGIKPHTLRDRLRRGFPVEEAIKVTPVQDCVRWFCEASYYKDWIGMSINDLHKLFWSWCISHGHKPIHKQGFSRQLFSMYPNLKTVPTARGEKCERIIRERS